VASNVKGKRFGGGEIRVASSRRAEARKDSPDSYCLYVLKLIKSDLPSNWDYEICAAPSPLAKGGLAKAARPRESQRKSHDQTREQKRLFVPDRS
jgi:hypothetical protein